MTTACRICGEYSEYGTWHGSFRKYIDQIEKAIKWLESIPAVVCVFACACACAHARTCMMRASERGGACMFAHAEP